MASFHVILGWEYLNIIGCFGTTEASVPKFGLGMCCRGGSKDTHCDPQLTETILRHIKMIVQYSRGLDKAAFHVILGWEYLTIIKWFATI